ncbi:MAG: right-handed parallel beta-helix repeat-containing protein [Spirochaetaceae bacterium]|nr:right-handed parallel beta-helix repeat-containing protein [Spirochaetaceae bacterium]
MERKRHLILFTGTLVAVLCIVYSCMPLGNIGEKLPLDGFITIIPYSNIIPGEVVRADISEIKYQIKPKNYQWYYADSQADLDEGNYKAIEGATEIAFQIPVGGDYTGKFLFVVVTDPAFNGSIISPAVMIRSSDSPEPIPGYITGEVIITHDSSGGSFVADISGVDFGAEGNPEGLLPSFTWYIDNKGDRNFDLANPLKGPLTAADGGDTLSLKDEYLDCIIQVEVKESSGTLKGAVYAEKLYTKPPEPPDPEPGYISGEVIITHDSSGGFFIADTSGVFYGDEGDDMTASFTWYIDNKGDRNFDLANPLKGPLTAADGGDTLPLKDKYLDCIIRVEVKESSGTLKGAVYAEKLYAKPPEPPVPEPGYISGEVIITHDSSGSSFVADISGLDFEAEGNPEGFVPSFIWYKDNQGDGNFSPLKGPLTADESGDTLPLDSAYLDCIIRVKVTASPLKGAVFAEKIYSERIEAFITGKVVISKQQADTEEAVDTATLKADTSAVIYGEAGNPEGFSPSFTWFKMDASSGGTTWTEITGETSDTLEVTSADLSDIIRVEVKESTGTLRGAVYAQRIVQGPFKVKTTEELQAPANLSEWIGGVEYTGTVPVTSASALTACLNWLNTTAQSYTMDGYAVTSNSLPLAARTFTITLDNNMDIGPQTLGTTTSNTTEDVEYPNIVGAQGNYALNIKIKGPDSANERVNISLTARGSIFTLGKTSGSPKAYINLSLEGNLTLEGICDSSHTGDSNCPVTDCSGICYELFEKQLNNDHVPPAGTNPDNNKAVVTVGLNCKLTMNEGVLITGNYSTLASGISLYGPLDMLGGTISHNATKSSYGGGVHCSNANATITMSGDATISDNTTKNNGGGIYTATQNTINMSGNARITNNRAVGKGGGIYAAGSGTTVTMERSAEISGNNAALGGGIYLNYTSTVEMSGSAVIRSNTATAQGGGIYNERTGTITMEGSAEITGNNAGTQGGGGIYIIQNKGIFNQNGCTVSNNTPDDVKWQ